ncbi:TPR repeat domain protein [Candidatus Rhodobacter oscarellae]|uniref:TPR repeat domain protein n=1 Tax=Candidatus Rhodobacter oscarellae TaxID=1675527 RepID=A0A0J9EAL5_9RHOB|nr:hypothetical protein [Candidatus Rhodobacter lobularis]KMW59651.1 TPR repeat domain protein [Candidatus Rhodobacter lobularis]
MTGKGKISVCLRGCFRVLSDKGENLTPKSAKAQGLIALVLSSDGFERGRIWLQDKLWSDRPQKQGGYSMRRALSDIRLSLGDYADILITDRSRVSLDQNRVDIEPAIAGQDDEFLEGLDIRDQEFNIWLAGQRSATKVPRLAVVAPALNKRPNGTLSILFQSETGKPGKRQLIENMFIDQVEASIREELNVEIIRQVPMNAPPGILVVSVQAYSPIDGQLYLRASIEDIDQNQVLWSQMASAQQCGAPATSDTKMRTLANGLTVALKWAASRSRPDRTGDTDANLLALMAVNKIFTLQPDNLVEAEAMLSQAFDIERRGVYKSWLVQLYTIQLVERIKPLDAISDKSAAACAHALELEPENSNVLASVADANLAVNRNFARSAQLAQMSVEANPSNPLAWWTMAGGHLYLNETANAYRAATVAQELAGGTRLRFWTDVQRGLTALVNGKTVEGLRNLESCSALSPRFRAPLRYRAAIYASAGMTEAAMDCAETLKKLEPDFSFDRMANDPSYPVSLMRKHGMLDTLQLD